MKLYLLWEINMQESNIIIAPSILSSDFSQLSIEISALEIAGANMLHLDIMDGHYVPNLTFGYVIIETIARITKLPLDAHLMVTNPQDYIDKLAKLGVTYFSFHPETVFHPHRVIQSVKDSGMKAGIALNPGIPVNSIDEAIQQKDHFRKPLFVIARKQGKFWKVREKVFLR